MIDDPELFSLFKAESEEHLNRLDDGLLRLEKTPADQALLEDIFRESHSLKGAARMLGLSKIESSAHHIESLFNSARKGETPLTPAVIEQMTGALSELRKRVGEALNDAPRSTFTSTISPASEETAATPSPPIAEPLRLDTVRVETRKLDDLLTQVGELSVIQGRTHHRLALMEELQLQWATLERSHRAGLTQRQAEATAASHFGTLLKRARDALFDDEARLEATVSRLEEQVRHIRLLPFTTIFAAFPRMVRDLAKDLGKEVELHLEGGDITVDKQILEEMKDPLMHLLRNAVDHGIEMPSEREYQGKNRSGRLALRVWREHDQAVVEVADDGCGLNLEAIRQTVLKRGLYDESSLAAMPSTQIQRLIFTPGFSTSAHITELSGRGVGLDVVRTNVERLKGNIHIESQPARGLSIQLRLPLSLATTRLLLVSAGGGIFGLPVECIHTSRLIPESEIFTLEGRTAILLEEQALMVSRLDKLLDLASGHSDAAMACIVLQIGEDRLGLLVDELLFEEEVVPKPLGAPLRRVRNISALTILGSGKICAILNPADLLHSAHRLSALTPPMTRHRIAAKPSVLLVEDSVLTRTMEKRILEDNGYEVTTAVDGLDGLNMLGHRTFSAVVSDVMMPNMDGLTLTAHIRREPRFKDLPIVLVTSLATDTDKRRGLEAGANAYIPKPSFDQHILLDTLKRLITP